MRSVPLLILLGAYLAPAVSLERRYLGSQDTSDKLGDVEFDIVERDGESFANQHPLARPEDALDGKPSIDRKPNADDDALNKVEASDVQNSRPRDSNLDGHSLLKRIPAFITITQLIYTPVVITSIFPVSVPVTRGSGPFVTVIQSGGEPITVTSLAFTPETTTRVYTESGPAYVITVPPPGATEEFFTSAYAIETRGRTFTFPRGSAVFYTVQTSGIVTVTEGIVTVTVTSTITATRNFFQTTFLPIGTQTIVVPCATETVFAPCASNLILTTAAQSTLTPTAVSASVKKLSTTADSSEPRYLATLPSL